MDTFISLEPQRQSRHYDGYWQRTCEGHEEVPQSSLHLLWSGSCRYRGHQGHENCEEVESFRKVCCNYIVTGESVLVVNYLYIPMFYVVCT